MKKLLITLAAIMGGVIVVLIAQAQDENNVFDMSGVTGIEGGNVFPGGPSEAERKAEAEEAVKGQLLKEWQEKQQQEQQSGK